MSITINNGLLVNCISFFLLSVFVSYMLRKAHLFFKPVIFLFLVLLLANVQQEHDLYKTVPVVLGVLLVYSDSIIQKISEVLDLIQDLFYKIKYSIVSLFASIIRFLALIFDLLVYLLLIPYKVLAFLLKPLFRLLGTGKKQRSDDYEYDCGESFSSGYQQTSQADQEDAVKQAKEEFRRARGDREDSDDVNHNTHTSAREDIRSYHEILGVPQNFTREDLRKAYKIAASRFHPDHYQHFSDSFRKEAEAELVKVNRAYNYLLTLL